MPPNTNRGVPREDTSSAATAAAAKNELDLMFSPVSSIHPSGFTLVDIRGQTKNSNTTAVLSQMITLALSNKTVPYHDGTGNIKNPSGGESRLLRSIPTLVLYDDRGLELFDQITYLDEYYLTNAEKQIFETWGDEIMGTCVGDGGVLVELGVG